MQNCAAAAAAVRLTGARWRGPQAGSAGKPVTPLPPAMSITLGPKQHDAAARGCTSGAARMLGGGGQFSIHSYGVASIATNRS